MVRHSASVLPVLINSGKRAPEGKDAKPKTRKLSRTRNLLKQIKQLQKRENPDIIPKTTITELIRKYLRDASSNLGTAKPVERIQGSAVIAIKILVERMALAFAEDSNMAAAHAKRVRVMKKDLDFITKLMPERDHENYSNGTFAPAVTHLTSSIYQQKGGKLAAYARELAVRHKNLKLPRYIRRTQIKRLFRMAGAIQMSTDVYEVMVGYIEGVLIEIMNQTVIYTAHAKRSTVMAEDVIRGAKTMAREPQTLYGFGC